MIIDPNSLMPLLIPGSDDADEQLALCDRSAKWWLLDIYHPREGGPLGDDVPILRLVKPSRELQGAPSDAIDKAAERHGVYTVITPSEIIMLPFRFQD